ncbi:hypothetical protein M1N70_01640 [Peptococcaceae bacterium]|nr:hypothetical protein [Peptococcaceae bacterium]
MCLVDSFDAMTTARPYKRAMNYEQAMQEIYKHAGSQFDPELVKAFIKAIPSIIK